MDSLGHTNLDAKRKTAQAGALIAAALAAISSLIAPQPARGQGVFDFLFGRLNGTPERVSPIAPTQPRYSGGGSVTHCVRLCDGQHFPLPRTANATPVEMCKSMCPASKTKVFSGSPIDQAVALDGTRYSNLDNAFVYRKNLVPDCTCNGKDAFGLAPLDINNDPTLQAGDLVATSTGLRAYSGERGPLTAEGQGPLGQPRR